MKTIGIDRALADPKLLGAAFGPMETWSTWRAVLKAAWGHSLATTEAHSFDQVSGHRAPPKSPVRELVAIAGRRSGKSRIAAAIATYLATCIDHSDRLSPAEIGMVLVLAASRSQARVVFEYIAALLDKSPILRKQVLSVGAEEIRLKGNVTVAVHANSFRTVRGRTLLACVFDEAAFWRDESSATPDVEVYRAVLPSLATTGGMLVCMSSPYRRTGLIASKHREAFGQDNHEVLVVQGGTPQFNPTIDANIIERARESDPIAAASEWDAQFRVDLQSFLGDDVIDAAVDYGRPLELPPRQDVKYHAFVDASAGRHDAFTMCIAHREGERVIADVIRGRKPPFDPAAVAREYAALIRDYHAGGVMGDAYAGNWVSAAFRDARVEYTTSPRNRSELYLESLPLWTRGLVSIPNIPQLLRELRLLERRTARSGRDSVDHGVGGSDDYANALCGAMWRASRRPDTDEWKGVGPIVVSSPRNYVGDAHAPHLAHGSEYTGGALFGLFTARR